jgi:hypothetical protein
LFDQGERTGALWTIPKSARIEAQTRIVITPGDLAASFREWQRLRKQVRDFELAAAHNTETIERHEREIGKDRKWPREIVSVLQPRFGRLLGICEQSSFQGAWYDQARRPTLFDLCGCGHLRVHRCDDFLAVIAGFPAPRLLQTAAR